MASYTDVLSGLKWDTLPWLNPITYTFLGSAFTSNSTYQSDFIGASNVVDSERSYGEAASVALSKSRGQRSTIFGD